MDEKQLKQLLEDIAYEEIPDDMNVWHEIRQQVETTNPRAMRRGFRLVRIGLLAALLVLATAAAYAVYQGLIGSDPGLDAVNQANLVTTIDETQAVGGDYNWSVTLHYAYADANRITIGYTVTGEAPAREQIRPFTNPLLKDSVGREYTWLPVGGGGGGGGGSGDPDELIQFEDNLGASFDASIIDGAPESLDLTLTIQLAYANDAARAAYGPNVMLPAGEATFDFSVPFIAGHSYAGPQAASASELEMTLQNVVVAPSLTRLDLCFAAPPSENGRPWNAFVNVTVDDAMVVEDFQLLPPIVPDPDSDCQQYIMPLSLVDYVESGEWTLNVTTLRAADSENVDIVAQRMHDEAGIDVTPHEMGGYMFNEPQPDMAEANAALARILAEEQQSIDGPWVFRWRFE
ncbi:MAG: DUF4179 domain-containing protein [Anaerolineae bacterium]|nr:DUF4179 domain-containing protein [Anaerolineae bacterium]